MRMRAPGLKGSPHSLSRLRATGCTHLGERVEPRGCREPQRPSSDPASPSCLLPQGGEGTRPDFFGFCNRRALMSSLAASLLLPLAGEGSLAPRGRMRDAPVSNHETCVTPLGKREEG